MTGEGLGYDIGSLIGILVIIGVPVSIVAYYIFKHRYSKKTKL